MYSESMQNVYEKEQKYLLAALKGRSNRGLAGCTRFAAVKRHNVKSVSRRSCTEQQRS